MEAIFGQLRSPARQTWLQPGGNRKFQFLSKGRFTVAKKTLATVFVMFLTLVLGAGSAAAADENKKEGKKEKDPNSISGVVKAVDAEKKTVTLEVKVKKNTEEKVLTLAADGSVKIAGKAATLADLKVGEKAVAKVNEKGEVVSLTSGKKEKAK